MRAEAPDRLEQVRIRVGPMSSDASYGLTGAFTIHGPCGRDLHIVSSGPDSDYHWEHVSVSLNSRPPNWQEMCFIKDLFWDEGECVVQFHPPRSKYVNVHPNCLHLWKRVNSEFVLPPIELL